MKIKLVRPSEDHPLLWVHAPLTTTDEALVEMEFVLSKSGYTMLGPWKPHIHGGKVDSMTAPVLKEDEHVKPRKRSAKK